MRDTFEQNIKTFLTDLGFVASSDQSFEKVINVTQPGQIMIINGQTMQQPSSQLEIKYIIEDMGPGSISNLDDSDLIDLETFMFSVYVKGDLRSNSCIVYRLDEFNDFKNHVLHILNS